MKKILVVRNDKLGDFVLSLPVYILLKKHLPDCELHVFVPEYTRNLASLCNSIDNIITDPGYSASLYQQFTAIKKIRQQNYDAVITLYSTTRVGLISFLSGIKYRLAPATKLAQIFYNHRLTQRRSRSLKPEYEYNIDLAVKFLNDKNISFERKENTPYLHFSEDEMKIIRREFCDEYRLKTESKFIFIHPGTGGSATNLDIEQYASLAKSLHIDSNTVFVITAGPGELDYAEKLSKLLSEKSHIVYNSTKGLVDFTKVINLCDLFISGSTGPLHIAGALDRPTAAFYQRRRSATPLRWQTLNSKDRRLAFTPPETASESDMQKIDIIEAAAIINDTFLKAN